MTLGAGTFLTSRTTRVLRPPSESSDGSSLSSSSSSTTKSSSDSSFFFFLDARFLLAALSPSPLPALALALPFLPSSAPLDARALACFSGFLTGSSSVVGSESWAARGVSLAVSSSSVEAGGATLRGRLRGASLPLSVERFFVGLVEVLAAMLERVVVVGEERERTRLTSSEWGARRSSPSSSRGVVAGLRESQG